MPTPQDAHRPGAVSLFFVCKAALFAAGFWAWLLVLVIGAGPVTGWHLLAAAGAVTTNLVAVLLGVRLALQRDAADRHAELRRTLADISWNTFAAAGNADSSGTVLPFPTSPSPSRRGGGDDSRDRRR